jgi:ParB/RepB/Spo0J family partition protein
LTNLKNSIETNSLQNPIFVRKNDQKPGFYIIVDGERRWRACKNLNKTKIKCRIVTSDAKGYKIVALVQNLHRDDLLPIERANALANLLARLQGSDDATQNALSKIVNLSQNYISELITISKLDDLIKEEALTSKKWSANKLLQLAKIKNADKRMTKFEEFKAIINKTPNLSDKKSYNTEFNSDSQSSSTDNSQSDIKLSIFKNHLAKFRKRLEKLNNIKINVDEKKELKAELLEIQKLIIKIFSG